MRLDKRFLVAAICTTLALATTQGARADTVEFNIALDGNNEVDLSNQVGNTSSSPGSIKDVAQGQACHGLNKDASGTANGYTITFIYNDSNQSIYLFTGPTCDGFYHAAQSGQVVQVSNSTNTGHNVLVKSYYFR